MRAGGGERMGERKQRMAGQRDRRRGEDLGTHNCRTETDARTLASWGVDYWKLDGCNVPISDMEVRYCCSLFTSGGREEGKRGETKGEIKESGERERAMTDTDYTGNPRDIERRQRSLFPASNHLSLSSASSSPSLLLILILILPLSHLNSSGSLSSSSILLLPTLFRSLCSHFAFSLLLLLPPDVRDVSHIGRGLIRRPAAGENYGTAGGVEGLAPQGIASLKESEETYPRERERER